MSILDFHILDQIGTGYTSKVYRVASKATNKQYAAKIVSKNIPNTDPDRLDRLKTEIDIHSTIIHLHIVKMLQHFEDINNVYIILDLCGDELFDVVTRTKFTIPEAFHIFRQLAQAVKYLHARNIIHRDIKLENVVKCGAYYKFIDLGFAKEDGIIDDAPGTLTYFAPEIALLKISQIKSVYSGKPADIWCMGILLFALLFARMPFSNSGGDIAILKRIINEPIRIPKDTNSTITNILDAIFNINPADRPTIKELLKHPYLSNLTNYFTVVSYDGPLIKADNAIEGDPDLYNSLSYPNKYNTLISFQIRGPPIPIKTEVFLVALVSKDKINLGTAFFKRKLALPYVDELYTILTNNSYEDPEAKIFAQYVSLGVL